MSTRPTDDDQARRNRLNRRAGLASIAVAVVLIAIKAWAFLQTGALSVAAALADSALDLVVSGAGLLGILYAAKPPDDDHSFGHSSVEDLFALGQALLVTGAAIAITASAITRFGSPVALVEPGIGVGVMLVSIALTLGLVAYQSRIAKLTGSRIVAADRLHYVGDLLPALGAILAFAASAALGLHWVDPVVALLAAAALLWAARGIGVSAWNALMDRHADSEQLALIGDMLADYPGLRGHHDLRTRTSGTRVFIQVHIELDGAQSLDEAHSVAANLKRDLIAAIPEADVIIHMDPV
jgi:ferrous-iron efflux pump FieF